VANEDKATRYHRLRRRAALLGAGTGLLVLVLLVLTGASAALRDLAEGVSAGSFTLTVVAYVVILLLIAELVQLPLAFYQGVALERRYGLSVQATAAWWRDQAKVTGLSLALGTVAALVTLHAIRLWPERWWLVVAAVFGAGMVVIARLAPVVLLPLFYDLKPLDRPALRDRLVALAERAGAPVLGVFEWRLGDRTRRANAALTGLGRTRRILLSDTLLADHSDDEVEVVLAHELAHHVHRDIWSGLLLELAVLTTGLWAGAWALEATEGLFGLRAGADVAALPVLLLAGGAVSLALTPIARAVSRAHERRADRFALDTTRNPGAFVSAMKRLGASNLAEDRPSGLVRVWLSHPSLRARLAAAEQWSRTNANRG